MTREETKELLMTINAIYPNFKVNPDQMTFTINAWHMVLKDYPATAINNALQKYANSSKSGFAPSVSQLIGNVSFIDKLRPESRKYILELDGVAGNLIETGKGDI